LATKQAGHKPGTLAAAVGKLKLKDNNYEIHQIYIDFYFFNPY
jgi:hypothetical protein